MDDREFEKIYDLLREFNRNFEHSLEKVNENLKKIAEKLD